MKQKLFIFLGLIVLAVLLVGLNAASYTQKEKMPDSEMNPNRSTFNGGATGTRAFFDLLAETGRKPVRWIESPAALKDQQKDAPQVFVITGNLRQNFTTVEADQLLEWVARGGRLVIIDRAPPSELVKTTADWEVSFLSSEEPFLNTDAYDQNQMTVGANAAKPVQPSTFVHSVNAVQPSRFASFIKFKRLEFDSKTVKKKKPKTAPTPLPTFSEKPATPKPAPTTFETQPPNSGQGAGAGRAAPSDEDYVEKTEVVGLTREDFLSAPIVHLANDKKEILVEVPYYSGRIVFLSDPYIVSNTGIGIADNVQLAVNLVSTPDGTIAFDEYHQGYGANQNRLLQFFAGTPVIAIFLQIVLLIGLIFYSQSRRFARAVPEPEPDRLSKLEYVSAMAELQQRTKGFDLAVENIYTDFRRRVARLVGVDNYSTPRRDLALLIVERLPDENADDLEALMKKCEDVMHGEKTGKKEVLRLTTRLREVEEKLGLQRRKKNRRTER